MDRIQIPERLSSLSELDDGLHESGGERHDSNSEFGGYAESATTRVAIVEAILKENDGVAERNRSDFDAAGVRAINLMSSPGAGKTTLLQQTLRSMGATYTVGVLEGDIATSIDADALTDCGAHSIALVNTSQGFGSECHLDATMVRAGLAQMSLPELDILIIENVGNLVCPAEFRVGEHRRAMVYAVTEGEEKPLKYPLMFRAVDVVVVNKIDLLPHLTFDMSTFLANLNAVNPMARVIFTSAQTGDGVAEWCAWLHEDSTLS